MEYGLYIRCRYKSNLQIVCHYVDDLFVTGSCLDEILEFKQKMRLEFEMTDLAKLFNFMGLELCYTDEGLILHQAKYGIDVLKWFIMLN